MLTGWPSIHPTIWYFFIISFVSDPVLARGMWKTLFLSFSLSLSPSVLGQGSVREAKPLELCSKGVSCRNKNFVIEEDGQAGVWQERLEDQREVPNATFCSPGPVDNQSFPGNLGIQAPAAGLWKRASAGHGGMLLPVAVDVELPVAPALGKRAGGWVGASEGERGYPGTPASGPQSIMATAPFPPSGLVRASLFAKTENHTRRGIHVNIVSSP